MLPLIFFLVETISTIINYLGHLLVRRDWRDLLHQDNLPLSFLVIVFKISDSALVKYRLLINSLIKNLFQSVIVKHGKSGKIFNSVAVNWRNILCYIHSNDDTDSSSESDHNSEKSYRKGKAKKFIPEKRKVRKLEAAKDVHSRTQTTARSKLSSTSVTPPTIFHPRLCEGTARKSLPVKRKEKMEAAQDVHSPSQTDHQSQPSSSSGCNVPRREISPGLRDLHTASCSKETFDKRTTARHSSKDNETDTKPTTSSLLRGPDFHRPRSELISHPRYMISTSYATGFPQEIRTKSSYLDFIVSDDSEISSESSEEGEAKERSRQEILKQYVGLPSAIKEGTYKMIKNDVRWGISVYRYQKEYGYEIAKRCVDEWLEENKIEHEQKLITAKMIRSQDPWYGSIEDCYEIDEKDQREFLIKGQYEEECKMAEEWVKSSKQRFERLKTARGRKNESSSEVDDEEVSGICDKTPFEANVEQKSTAKISKIDTEHARTQTGAMSKQSSNVTPPTVIHPRVREGKARKSLPVKRKEVMVAAKDMHSPAQANPECRSLSKGSTIPRTDIHPGLRDSRRQSSKETSDERIAASHSSKDEDIDTQPSTSSYRRSVEIPRHCSEEIYYARITTNPSSKDIGTIPRISLHQRRLDLYRRQSLIRNLAIKQALLTTSDREILDSEAFEPGMSAMDKLRHAEKDVQDMTNQPAVTERQVREFFERLDGPTCLRTKDLEYKSAKYRYRLAIDKVRREKDNIRLEECLRERRKYLLRIVEMRSRPRFEKSKAVKKKDKDSKKEKETRIKRLEKAKYEWAKKYCKGVKKYYEMVKVERGRKDESSSEVDDSDISDVDDENSPHSD